MGAVQKLATIVIIGLVALATVLTVYLADESNRRDGRETQQDRLAIERGTELYIQYCLQCHGPAGLGSSGTDEPARVGAVLNQAAVPAPADGWAFTFQSDDPVLQDAAADYIEHRILNGAPSDPRSEDEVMPAFGQELNEQQIANLVYTVQNVDWNYVYNQAVTETGETVAESECIATPDANEYCGNIEEAPPLYPTAPPEELAEETGGEGADPGQAGTPAAGSEDGGAAAMTLEAQDPANWSETEITLAPGDTIEVVNVGFSQHDFVVDDLGINEDLPAGEPVMVTIPADAQPGQYEFYCSVPGHAELGMVGTLTIEG